MDADEQKVIELICAELPSKDYKGYDDYFDITLYEDGFIRQGMSIDKGVSILKHKLVSNAPIFEIGDIHRADPDWGNGDETRFGQNCVTMYVHPAICDSLDTERTNTKPKLSFKDCILSVDGTKISFGSIDAKENSCYVLEHLFSHDLSEPSDYHDIHDSFFGKDPYTSKRFYDASQVIQKRVAKEAGIAKFLLSNSRANGSVRINPEYLP